MKFQTTKTFLTLITTLFYLLLPQTAMSAIYVSDSKATDLLVTYTPDTQLNSVKQNSFIQLNVKSVRDSYEVDEKIQFEVVGGNDYYIYVYELSKQGSTILIPNRNTKSNHMRANKKYIIPNTVGFRPQRKGIYKFAFIASKHPIHYAGNNFNFESSKNTTPSVIKVLVK